MSDGDGRDLVIRGVRPEEVGELARLQFAALPGSLPNLFGRRFVLSYYRALIADPEFRCDACFDGPRMVGFVAYTADSDALFRRVLRLRGATLALAALAGVILRPRRWPLLARVASHGSGEPMADWPGELLSMAVLPELRGRGRDERGRTVARRLMEKALRKLDDRRVPGVRCLTKPAEEDSRAFHFFARYGFEPRGIVTRLGRRAELHLRPGPGRSSPGPFDPA